MSCKICKGTLQGTSWRWEGISLMEFKDSREAGWAPEGRLAQDDAPWMVRRTGLLWLAVDDNDKPDPGRLLEFNAGNAYSNRDGP